MPYKGAIAFQLPIDAIPPELLAGASDCSSSQQQGLQLEQSSELVHYGITVGGPGWAWGHFSYLKDDARAARSKMAMVSLASSGLFR